MRSLRATTAPPAVGDDISYFGVMPFNRSLAAIEDRIRARAASVDPINTYRRAYATQTPYGATTAFDYKVRSQDSKPRTLLQLRWFSGRRLSAQPREEDKDLCHAQCAWLYA